MNILSNFVAISLFFISTNLQAANYCGELKSSYGPFDYTDSESRPSDSKYLVEMAHFTPDVEHLIKGNTGSIGGDLAYTLAVFPNHHRALIALGKLAIRDKNIHPYGLRFSVDCYFDRAIRFKAKDGMVRMVYGIYLSQSGNLEKAIEQMDEAVNFLPENATVNYNAGLLHFKKKNYADARKYAKKAYALGFPLPGLRKSLTEVGKWDEPAE